LKRNFSWDSVTRASLRSNYRRLPIVLILVAEAPHWIVLGATVFIIFCDSCISFQLFESNSWKSWGLGLYSDQFTLCNSPKIVLISSGAGPWSLGYTAILDQPFDIQNVTFMSAGAGGCLPVDRPPSVDGLYPRAAGDSQGAPVQGQRLPVQPP
jgi:hypothetical protein